MQNPLGLDGIPAVLAGLKLLGIAGFFAWYYFRANKQEIFLLTSGALGLNGLLAIFFLSGSEVSAFGIVLNAIAFVAVWVCITAMLASKIYHLLPQFEFIHEETMVDPDKGIQLHFMAISALIFIIAMRLFMGNSFLLIEDGLKLRASAWILYILLSIGVGYLATYLMPFDVKRDAFVTVHKTFQSIDIFEIKNNISPGEKAGVPAVLFILFFLIPFIMKTEKISGDYIGFFILFFVFASFIKFQFFPKVSLLSFGGKK